MLRLTPSVNLHVTNWGGAGGLGRGHAGRAGTGRGRPGRGGTQDHLIPGDEVTGGRPRRGPPLGPPDGQERLAGRRHRARQRHVHRGVRSNVRHRQPAVPGDLAVHQQLPRRREIGEAGERPAVGHPQPPPNAAAHQLDRHGPVHPRHLAHRRVGGEVGGHQPVGHEVAVVGLVVEVAAVCQADLAAGRALAQAVVLPLPDEPALQAGRGGDDVPVVRQRPVGVAHRVAVLAHDQRAVAGAGLAEAADGLDPRVHRAHQIRRRQPSGGPVGVDLMAVRRRDAAVAVEHRTLVVQRAGRVRAADPAGQRVVVAAVPALVAQAPEDDARVVAVALHHPCATLQPGGAVPRVLAQRRVVGVALDVGLVDHVHAELVAQVVERVVVRIVRRAHGSDVVRPHRQQVGTHVVHRHGLAAVRMVVVAVHPEHPDRLPVDQQLAIAHLHEAATHLHVAGLHHPTRRRQQLTRHRVPVGPLGRPRPARRQVERRRHRVPGEHVRHVEPVRHLTRHHLAAQPHAHRPPALHPAWEGDLSGDGDPAGAGGGVVVARSTDIGEVDRPAGLQPHRPVQPGHPPLVLVLHVALRAVPPDHHGQVVAGASVGQERGDVVLARQPAVGAVAGEGPVDVHGVDALRPTEVQHHLLPVPCPRHGEPAAVHAHRLTLRQRRRRARERHLHVGVVGQVVHAADEGALQRPVSRHGHGVRGGTVRPDGGRRHRVRVLEQGEAPRPVQRLAKRAGDRGVHRQPADRHDGRVRPGAQGRQLGQHDQPLSRQRDGAAPRCPGSATATARRGPRAGGR